MYRRALRFVDRHVGSLAALLTLGVIVLWGVAQAVEDVEHWIISRDFLTVIVIVLLADALRRIASLAPSERRVRIYENQAAAGERLELLVRERPPNEARLIELSSITSGQLLECLAAARCPTKLLIQHPDAAMNDFQRNDRIKPALKNFGLNTNPNLQIRCYKTPVSLKAQQLVYRDRRVTAIGWYRYVKQRETGLVGHLNPLVVSEFASPAERQLLDDLFACAFDDLWDHPDSVPFEAVPVAQTSAVT